MKKTIHLHLVAFLFLWIPTLSFSQGFVWSNQVELLELGTVASLGYSARDVELDANGNSYMVGNYVDTQKFGDSTLMSMGFGTPPLQNDDAYIAKYAPDGSFFWVETFPSSFGSYLHDIEIDNSGNIYMLFSFFDDINIGSTLIQGDEGFVLAKMDMDLELEWYQTIIAPSTGFMSVGNLALSATDIFMTGSATVEVSMGGTVLNPNQRAYVISLDNENGTINWTDETGFEAGAMDTDPNGNLYLTTNVNYIAAEIIVANQTITSIDGAVMLFIKYDDEGNVVWAKTSGNGEAYPNNVKRVVVNPTNGDIYYVGQWGNTLNIDGNIMTENIAFTAKLMFLAKFNAAGELQWVKSSNYPAPSPNVFLANISNQHLDISPDGGVFLGAQYVGGEMSLGEGANEVPFGYDGLGFIAKYAANGDLEWAKKLRCLKVDCELTVRGIAAVEDNQAVFTGWFNDTFDLDEVPLIAVVPDVVSQPNMYLVKIDGDLMTTSSNVVTNNLHFQISPNPSNNFLQIKTENHFQNCQIELVDLMGKILLRADYQGYTKQINLNEIPSGTYFLRMIGDEIYGVQKLIIQN